MPDLIMAALFQRGAFDAAAAARAGAVLAAYAVGLPAVVLIRSAVASFYARADTVTPLIASLAAVAVNVALKIVLMRPVRRRRAGARDRDRRLGQFRPALRPRLPARLDGAERRACEDARGRRRGKHRARAVRVRWRRRRSPVRRRRSRPGATRSRSARSRSAARSSTARPSPRSQAPRRSPGEGLADRPTAIRRAATALLMLR